MHLWTEYEGNTLAGYLLGRLTRSEGRSAFFLTTAEGQPALLRLTESHFDEGELIGRWKQAAAVKHPGLQAIRNAGQTTFDGVALAFCELEPTDASLSDVLRERVLTAEEAAEVAEAVAGALMALHSAGLVHGHVDAINVFAAGEAVKLRSDCTRECTGDFEADTAEAREALRQRDVHDLGLLLRRCLTPQWEESTAMQLPSPFDRIVRRALNGTVDAAGIVAEVEALKPAIAPPVEVRKAAAPAVVAGVPSAERPAPVDLAPIAARPVAARQVAAPAPVAARVAATSPAGSKPGPEPVSTSRRKGVGAVPAVRSVAANSPDAVSALLAGRDDRTAMGTAGEFGHSRFVAERTVGSESRAALDVRLDGVRNRLRHNTGTKLMGGMLQGVDLDALRTQMVRRKGWIASSAVLALLALVLWNTTGGAHGVPAASHVASGRSAPVAPKGVDVAATPAVQPPQVVAVGAARPAQRSLLATGEQAGWHVIAYTYRYEKQAATKASQLKERYVGLEPQVYSPTGRAPFFVALGGPSDAVSAIALRNRARRVGLPRDTYARNF